MLYTNNFTTPLMLHTISCHIHTQIITSATRAEVGTGEYERNSSQ